MTKQRVKENRGLITISNNNLLYRLIFITKGYMITYDRINIVIAGFHLQHCSHNSTRNFAKLDLRNVNCDSMCGLSHFRINYALSGNRTRFLNTYRLNGLCTPCVCVTRHTIQIRIWLFNAKQEFALFFLPSYTWFRRLTYDEKV